MEMGLTIRQFNYLTRNGKSIVGIKRDAREKGIILLKEYSMTEKKFRWIIYKVKMK